MITSRLRKLAAAVRSRLGNLAWVLAVLAALLASLAALSVTLKLGGGDDAHITYEFARNVAEGEGFVWYEGGPKVYGTSTITYALLLAFLGKVGAHIPTASVVLGALAWGACCPLVFLLTRRLSGPWTALGASALLASAAAKAAHMSAGMEAPLYALLALSCFALYAFGRLRLALLLGALLVLTRLDGALVPLLVGAHHLAATRDLRSLLRAGWPAALALTVGLAALAAYFGSPLPQSFVAKTAFPVDISGRFYPAFYAEFFRPDAPGRLGLPPDQTPWAGAFGLLVVVGATVGVARAAYAWRLRSSLLILWLPAYILMFSLSGMPHQWWYYAASLPAVFAAFTLGASWPAVAAEKVGARAALATAAAALVCVGAAWSSLHSWHLFAGDPWGEGARTGLHVNRLAAFVKEDARRHGVKEPDVLAYEVGFLGWGVDGRVHDMLGLVSPSAIGEDGSLRPGRFFHQTDPDYLVAREMPDYPILRPVYRSRKFQEEFRRVHSLPEDPAAPYTVFAKRSQR